MDDKRNRPLNRHPCSDPFTRPTSSEAESLPVRASTCDPVDPRIPRMSQKYQPRLAILVDGLQVGGSERQALQLAAAWRVRSVDVSILSLSGDGPLAAGCRERGIPVDSVALRFPYCLWRLPVNLWRGERLLRRQRPDVLLGFGSVSNLYAPLLKRRLGLQRVIWFQRNAGRERPPRMLERLAMRRTDAFSANSPAGIDFLADAGISRDRMALIPNGVRLPPAVFDPGTWRARFGIPSGAPLACMLANLRTPKDPLTVVRAWAQLCPPDTPPERRLHLVLAGREDALAEPVRAAIRDLRLDTWVHLPGCVDDVAGLLAACDFAVFSSRSEGLPNGVLEPMAAGKAVVATDLPGTRYCLGERMQEWLVPPGDVAAMADRVRRLLADRGLRREIGQRNRDRAQTLFSVDATCRATLDWILTH